MGARTHGLSHKHPLYASWKEMRQRCSNPNNKEYARYGGRGITVDPRWDDFALFVADMGERPGPRYSIDRIDNDGPYSPENCRWASSVEQRRNQRIYASGKCRNGHSYEEFGYYHATNGSRVCRACACEASRRYRERKAVA